MYLDINLSPIILFLLIKNIRFYYLYIIFYIGDNFAELILPGTKHNIFLPDEYAICDNSYFIHFNGECFFIIQFTMYIKHVFGIYNSSAKYLITLSYLLYFNILLYFRFIFCLVNRQRINSKKEINIIINIKI